jgi:hypothetical protein
VTEVEPNLMVLDLDEDSDLPGHPSERRLRRVSIHVPLAIVDELQPETEISIAAAKRSGKLILDVVILEGNTS